MSRVIPSLYLLGLLALGLTSCDGGETKEQDWFCGAVSLSLADGQTAESLSGDVSLLATLSNADAEPADLSLAYRLDGGYYQLATVEGALAGQSSGEDASVGLTWKSGEDLPDGSYAGLSLKLVAKSSCGLWDQAVLEGLTVANSPPEALCAVAVDTPADGADGPFAVNLSISHPDSLPAYLKAEWSLDGADWSRLTLADADCDGDGARDQLTDLATSPEGVSHCFTWDSQQDVAEDAKVSIRLTCGVGFEDQGEVTSGQFEVENDPTPGPNELVFSEFMAVSSLPDGEYIEVYNLSSHILNLQDVVLARWSSSKDPDTSSPSASLTITDPTETVLVRPGAYFVLAASTDRERNGCLRPDVSWQDTSFTFNENSTFRLELDGEVLAEQSILSAEGWSFIEGRAIGLDPDKLTSGDSYSNWCKQYSVIETCEESTETDLGTPGGVNDGC